MLNFFHVARNTLRECLREPIFFVLLLSAVVLIGLFPTFSLFVFREQTKLVTDSAMATTLLFGLVAAVLAASHTVTREMKNGTVLLLLSKPVHRWSFILAKISGITVALTIFVFVCNVSTLVSLRVAKDQFRLDYTAFYIFFGLLFLSAVFGAIRNYYFQACFSSSATVFLLVVLPVFTFILNFMKAGNKVEPIRVDVIPALILIFFSVWIMGTITVALSTRLNMVANLTISSLIFFLGLISNYLFLKSPGETNVVSGTIYGAIYAVVPNWQFFWMADALASNQKIPLSYIAWSGAYVVFYIIFCSLIAIAMFKDREVAIEIR